MARTDAEIQHAVVRQIHADDRLSAAEISVACADGAITLEGVAPTYAARIAAESDTREIPGVRTVDNRTLVQRPAALYRPSDDELRVHLERHYLWNPHLKSGKIAVRVDEGVVRLSGSVDAFWKKIRAEEMAYDIGGVLAVFNDLAVFPARPRDDAEIVEAIEAGVARGGQADVSALSIHAHNGDVALKGPVSDWNALHAVYRIAMHTNGVTGITNALVISPKAE